MPTPPLRLAVIFGTRPEAIKMAPVCRALRGKSSDYKTSIIVTAQHRDMLDQVMGLFGLSSDHDLNIMQQNQTLDFILTQTLSKLTPILNKEKPDLVLVHGDTLTTFAAALAAFYLHIPVGHVEAGLRSYDTDNPFPEESNRVLTDHLSALHFAPTHQARQNLLKENIPEGRIFVTGNTVTDALKMALQETHRWSDPILQKLFSAGIPEARMILLTAHRRENLGAPMENVFRALRRTIEDHPDTILIYPVHLNPKVQDCARRVLGSHPRIHLIPPVDYHDLVNLLQRSHLVVTDSGGIQEEAPVLGKPVLVLRKVTERPEAVAAGTARVIGVEEKPVYDQLHELLSNQSAYARMANAINPYGDGKATPRILDAIAYHFGLLSQRPEEFLGDLAASS